MKYCTKCGTILNDQAICPNCGEVNETNPMEQFPMKWYKFLLVMLIFTGIYVLAYSINTVIVCGIFPAGGDAKYDAISVFIARSLDVYTTVPSVSTQV